MAKVGLYKCGQYDLQEIKKIVLQGLKDIGFDISVFTNKKVGLKPNFLFGTGVEAAITTHPVFTQAVCEIVIENKGIPMILESPVLDSIGKAIEKCGYSEFVKKYNIALCQDREVVEITYTNNNKFKSFYVLKDAIESDMIINLPKLKTHNLTYMTGAVKNIFGFIPGLEKPKWHLKAHDNKSFSGLLLDLNEVFYNYFKPPKMVLHIMDAIIGIEGDGPGTGGMPRKMGAIIVGDNPVAVDYTAAQILKLDIKQIFTLNMAFSRNLGISTPDEIQYSGEKIESMHVDNIKLPSQNSMLNNLSTSFAGGFFRNIFLKRPVPKERVCTLCYKCKTICQANAIDKSQKNRKTPRFDYNKCVRCFCCSEICPEAAIKIRNGSIKRFNY